MGWINCQWFSYSIELHSLYSFIPKGKLSKLQLAFNILQDCYILFFVLKNYVCLLLCNIFLRLRKASLQVLLIRKGMTTPGWLHK